MIIFGSKAERKNSIFKKQGPDFVTTGLVLIWQSLSDSDMSDTHSSHHLPFLRYLRSKQASSHCDFSNVTLCPQRPFCIRRKSFFFPSALLSLCNLLSCSFSQRAENRLGLKGLLFNWKHLGGRELDWWGAVETGYYGISTSLASDWWRRETLARVQGWSGYTTTLPSAVWGQWHSSCCKGRGLAVSTTSEMGWVCVCLWLSDRWDLWFVSAQHCKNPTINQYLCPKKMND